MHKLTAPLKELFEVLCKRPLYLSKDASNEVLLDSDKILWSTHGDAINYLIDNNLVFSESVLVEGFPYDISIVQTKKTINQCCNHCAFGLMNATQLTLGSIGKRYHEIFFTTYEKHEDIIFTLLNIVDDHSPCIS